MAKSAKREEKSRGGLVKFIAVIAVLLAAAYVMTSLIIGVWNPLKWSKAQQAQSGQEQEDNSDFENPETDEKGNGEKESEPDNQSATTKVITVSTADDIAPYASDWTQTMTVSTAVGLVDINFYCNLFNIGAFQSRTQITGEQISDQGLRFTVTTHLPKQDGYAFAYGTVEYWGLGHASVITTHEIVGSGSSPLVDSLDVIKAQYEAYSLTIKLNLTYKETVSLPEIPVKEGYTFVGWYYDSAFTKPYDNAPIFEDTQLYAKFEVNSYTVTFNSNGGSRVENRVVNYNSTITPVTPQRQGYNFVGWYYSNGTKYENQPITSDTSLTARWEVKLCTVTFMVDGKVYVTRQVEWGTSFSALPEVASLLYLQILDVTSDNAQSLADGVVMDNSVTITAKEMTGGDKAFTYINNNKWKVVECVAVGVVALIVIAAICATGRKSKKTNKR